MTNDEHAEITGDWDHRFLRERVSVGRNCWFEQKDGFGTFHCEQQPGLAVGDRVKLDAWTTTNPEKAASP